MSENEKEPVCFIRIKKVSELVGFSESMIRRYAQQGIFPKPIKISKRTTVWRKGVVLEWKNSLESE
jgi:predicted DNA-binding transcriptional regulator AlpA